jgi:hypothetical protein
MNPAPIGTRIQVICKNHHNYQVGRVYRVHQVDGDGTLKAIDDFGIEGDFLRWKDCQPVGIGWEWIREHLDARSLDLLSAFDGLDHLRLRDEVEAKVITVIPNLAGAILDLLPAVEEEMERLRNQAPEEGDIDNLFI